MKRLIKRAKKAGVSLVEYGMLVALIAIVAMVVVKTTGGKATSTYDNIQSQMTAQGIDSMAPQTPGGGTASTTGTSGGSGSNKQNNGNHNGQNRSD